MTLEETIKENIKEVYDRQKGLVNEMLRPEFVSCEEEIGELTLRFPFLEWEGNRIGNMHGGIIATIFDYSAGVMARFYGGLSFAPTVSMEVKYIRPIVKDDKVIVSVKTIHAGKRIIQLAAEAATVSKGKLMATATITYLAVDTSKQ